MTGDFDAVAGTIELESVIAALQRISDQSAFAQRVIAMTTAIFERDDFAGLIPIQSVLAAAVQFRWKERRHTSDCAGT